MLLLEDFNKANKLFFFDIMNVKKLIERKFANSNLIPLSFFEDKILFFNKNDDKLYLHDYKINIVENNIVMHLKKGDIVEIMDKDLNKKIMEFAKGEIAQKELITFLENVIFEKHQFFSNIQKKLFENYTNVYDYLIDFDLISAIVEEYQDDINDILNNLKDYTAKLEENINKVYLTEGLLYYNVDKDYNIILSGTKYSIYKEKQFENYRKYIVSIFRETIEAKNLIKNKNFIKDFIAVVENKQDIQDLFNTYRSLKYVPENELKDLISKMIIKAKIKISLKEKIYKIFQEGRKLFENERKEVAKFIKVLNEDEKEQLVKMATEQPKDKKEENPEEVEKNIKSLNKDNIKELKDIFEKIKEYLDTDTTTYDYVEHLINFLENLETGNKNVDPDTIYNILIILKGELEPHPAVKDSYEKEEPEKKEKPKEENKEIEK